MEVRYGCARTPVPSCNCPYVSSLFRLDRVLSEDNRDWVTGVVVSLCRMRSWRLNSIRRMQVTTINIVGDTSVVPQASQLTALGLNLCEINRGPSHHIGGDLWSSCRCTPWTTGIGQIVILMRKVPRDETSVDDHYDCGWSRVVMVDVYSVVGVSDTPTTVRTCLPALAYMRFWYAAVCSRYTPDSGGDCVIVTYILCLSVSVCILCTR